MRCSLSAPAVTTDIVIAVAPAAAGPASFNTGMPTAATRAVEKEKGIIASGKNSIDNAERNQL